MSTSDENPLGIETGELLLLAVFGVFSLFILVTSYQYAGFAGRYPRFIAAVTLVAVIALAVRNFLPQGTLYRIFFVSPEMFSTGRGAEEDEEEEEEVIELSPYQREEGVLGVLTANRSVIAISTIGYLVVGYLIGLLYATPIYMFAYLVWQGAGWVRIVGLTIVAYVIGWVFMNFFNVPLGRGLVQEMIGLAILPGVL